MQFLLFFFEKQIAFEIYKNEEFIGILENIAITLPIFTFIQIQKSLLRSFNLPEISNFSDIGCILFLCCVITVYFNVTEIYLDAYKISLFFLFSCIFVFCFNNIVIFNVIFSNLKKLKKNTFIDLKKKLIKTLPDYFTIDFINYSLVWGSIFICTFFYEPIKIGNFSTTYWLAFSLLFFPLILNSIYAPSYAINLEKKNKKKLKIIFNQNRNISIIITLPIFTIIFFFPELILSEVFKIYSNEYSLILRILLISSMLRVIFGPQVLFLNMSDKQKKLKFISIFCALLQIILIYISVVNFNLMVLSVSFLLSNLIKHILLKIELQNYFLEKL